MTLISTTPIYPENHAMGAVASFSENTDTTNIEVRHKIIAILNKYNLGASIYQSVVNPLQNSDLIEVPDYKAMEEYGRCTLSLYHRTQYMNDPTQPNGVIRHIPDFAKTAYTEYGARKFENANDGDLKDIRTPNHGQEMYDITNGRLGWDSLQGWGESNGREFKELIKYEKRWLEQFKGGKPVIAGSYSLGRDITPDIRLPYLIVCRNSDSNGNTNYGVSKIDGANLGTGNNDLSHLGLCALPSTARNAAISNNYSTITANAQDALDNNGWYQQFTHWQDISNLANADGYFNAIATVIGSNFVFSSDMGSVAAYKLLRDSFVSGNALEDDGGFIDLEIELDIADTINPMYLLQPLSFQIDTSGTVLTGLDITSNDSVRIFKESANVFTIDIDFRNYPTGRTIRLTDTLTPNYTSKAKPVISNIVESGGVITFDTDIPTKSSLFYTTRGGNYYDSALVARDTELKTSHSFDLNDSAVLNQIQPSITSADVLTNDVYIAVNSEINQSVLSTVQQFA